MGLITVIFIDVFYFHFVVFGVSYVRCDKCNFTNNLGINSRDEYGAAVGIYLVNQFGSRESAPRYEFTDWYVMIVFRDSVT